MFRQIIVGLDGSERAKRATHIACDLGKHYAGVVTLIHVPHAEAAAFSLGEASDYHADISAPSFEEIEAAGRKILDEGLEIAENLGFKTIKTHMPHGDAATEIILHAEEIGADLIVTGRRGLSRFSTLILGSTTLRVNQMAKCACLSVV